MTDFSETHPSATYDSRRNPKYIRMWNNMCAEEREEYNWRFDKFVKEMQKRCV